MIWKKFVNEAGCESPVRILLKVFNQLFFLLWFTRLVQMKMSNQFQANNKQRFLTLVLSFLFANYVVWPLMLITTHFFLNYHNHWILALLMVYLDRFSNRFGIDQKNTSLEGPKVCYCSYDEMQHEINDIPLTKSSEHAPESTDVSKSKKKPRKKLKKTTIQFHKPKVKRRLSDPLSSSQVDSH
ncbi:uncharacterized protein LOC118182542 [Stegodyphus dumicola]|uniref:uncharacterized protein LOC118182542 n=1 Tax=Stegodyphus dumicola TaxID=202533 RepID=UPI0015AB936B|nr:uncharacterized protein LOC118182542 [Stegodyphus dumicola]